MQRPLQPYHYAWLSAHPERTEEWLRNKLSEGFQIHHINKIHEDNHPNNLILIEQGDHFLLHNGVKRFLFKGRNPNKNKRTPEEAKLWHESVALKRRERYKKRQEKLKSLARAHRQRLKLLSHEQILKRIRKERESSLTYSI